MNFTWMGGIVLLILLLAFILGYRKGFIKEVVSMFFLAMTFALVWFLNPYVNSFLSENTPVYEKVYTKSEELVNRVAAENPKEKLVENLPVPDIVKKNILKNNTEKGYQILEADSFSEYLVNYLAEMIMKGISFVIAFLLAAIVIRILAYFLNLIAKLPVLNGINKLLGGLLGTTRAVIFIWIVMLVITLLCNTKPGIKVMEWIEQDTILSVLYNNNILVRIFMSILHMGK